MLMEKSLVATSKFGYLNIWQHSITRKNLFLYLKGDRSHLRKPKQGQASTLITATTGVHLMSVSTDLMIQIEF